MKVVLHRVDLRVRVVGTHFPYKTGLSNSMQQRAVRKSTARFQDDGHRCRSTTRCRGNAGRIAEFWPRRLAPSAGHARRSEGFVRGDVQQQRVGRKSTAHFQDDGHRCRSTTRCRGNARAGSHTSLCENVLNGLDAGEAGSILRYCPRCPGSAQWIHVHARRLGSEAFRTVTGRQLP